MNRTFNLQTADPSWHDCLHFALGQMDPDYLANLQENDDWLPGPDNIFRAFSQPLNKTNYILLGESPYPRKASANGYAFWDAAVGELWCGTGLNKTVNRATSLRNLIKMMLIADGQLQPGHTTQSDIAGANKMGLVSTASELFQNFLDHGFLLLNATPVLRISKVREDARAWQPFLREILSFVGLHRPDVTLVLFGRIAASLGHLADGFNQFIAEHPYNLSFIANPDVLNFFRPLSLLRKTPATIPYPRR